MRVLLKQEKIDIAVYNKEGKNPKDIATEMKNEKINKLLSMAVTSKASLKMLANDALFDK